MISFYGLLYLQQGIFKPYLWLLRLHGLKLFEEEQEARLFIECIVFGSRRDLHVQDVILKLILHIVPIEDRRERCGNELALRLEFLPSRIDFRFEVGSAR